MSKMISLKLSRYCLMYYLHNYVVVLLCFVIAYINIWFEDMNAHSDFNIGIELVQQLLGSCGSISTFDVYVEYLKTIDSGSCNYVSSGEQLTGKTHRSLRRVRFGLELWILLNAQQLRKKYVSFQSSPLIVLFGSKLKPTYFKTRRSRSSDNEF